MIKKICIFTFSYSANRQSMLEYLERIMPEDVEIYLFTTKAYQKQFKTNNIKVVDTDCNRFTSAFKLRDFCKKNKIQRIFNIGLLPYEAIPMVYASLFAKTDFIPYHLGNPVEGVTTNKGLTKIRSFFELASYFVFAIPSKKIGFCSPEITNFFKKYLFFTKNKVFFLPTTIPTELFKPVDKSQVRRKLGFKQDEKIIIFVGRIGYLKGLDIFINAVENNPDKKFILIGNIVDSSYKDKNLKNLTLIPPKSQQELAEYYNVADLCFFPSRLEGVALVPREAMACGTPAMVLDIMSSKAIEKAIKLPIDYKKINQEITNFFNLSIDKRQELSKESREYIIKEYDDKIWKSLYIDIFLN